jgi:hypothetical protein
VAVQTGPLLGDFVQRLQAQLHGGGFEGAEDSPRHEVIDVGRAEAMTSLFGALLQMADAVVRNSP